MPDYGGRCGECLFWSKIETKSLKDGSQDICEDKKVICDQLLASKLRLLRDDAHAVRNVNKLSALRTDPVCFSFRSLLELAEVIFSANS